MEKILCSTAAAINAAVKLRSATHYCCTSGTARQKRALARYVQQRSADRRRQPERRVEFVGRYFMDTHYRYGTVLIEKS